MFEATHPVLSIYPFSSVWNSVWNSETLPVSSKLAISLLEKQREVVQEAKKMGVALS